MQSSRGFELDAAVLGDHGAQPFGRLGQVNVTDVTSRPEGPPVTQGQLFSTATLKMTCLVVSL